jgi:hypothetical protein
MASPSPSGGAGSLLGDAIDPSDRLVASYDVFYSNHIQQGLESQVLLCNYPLRPPWRPYDLDSGRPVRYKRQAKRLEADVQLERNDEYNDAIEEAKRIEHCTLRCACARGSRSRCRAAPHGARCTAPPRPAAPPAPPPHPAPRPAAVAPAHRHAHVCAALLQVLAHAAGKGHVCGWRDPGRPDVAHPNRPRHGHAPPPQRECPHAPLTCRCRDVNQASMQAAAREPMRRRGRCVRQRGPAAAAGVSLEQPPRLQLPPC